MDNISRGDTMTYTIKIDHFDGEPILDREIEADSIGQAYFYAVVFLSAEHGGIPWNDLLGDSEEAKTKFVDIAKSGNGKALADLLEDIGICFISVREREQPSHATEEIVLCATCGNLEDKWRPRIANKCLICGGELEPIQVRE